METKAYLVHVVYVLILETIFPGLVAGLRLTRVEIPHYGVQNDRVLLECNFDLEKVQLFSLKWYKDGHEFFRYKPADDPKITVFPLTGVNVNKNQSSMNQVALEPVTLQSKGLYKCEVSADAPSFLTIQREQYMNVMIPPKRGPEILGTHPWYNIGDNFTANCSVEKTFPQPRLSWFVNGDQFTPEDCGCITTETFEHGKALDGTMFFSAFTQISFPLDTPFFQNGFILVECKVGYYNSMVVLRAKSQSNVKVGFGGHYYANIFSSAVGTCSKAISSVVIIGLASLIVSF